jgi:hypothetical protein
MALPSGRPTSSASGQLSTSRPASASSARQPPAARSAGAASASADAAQKKKKNRESYLEAISMGSLNEDEGRYSRTSEPIDL